MVAAATTLRDIIEAAWNLTGELSKVVTGAGPTLMDEVVNFYDRAQVAGNQANKSVTVEKINAELEEVVVKHPNFNEVSDIYDITVYYKVVDVDRDNYSSSLDLIEQMATEVISILTTTYNPSVPTNIYFKSTSSWTNEDVKVGNQIYLQRRLRFELTTINADITTVYPGLSGVLIFDTSASQGDSKPGADYTYLEVMEVQIREGYAPIPLLTKDLSKGVGVPFLTRGLFSGTIVATTFAAKANIIGSTIDKIQNIYKTQGNSPIIGQLAEVVFLHNLNDLTASPNNSTFVTQSFLKIDNIVKSSLDNNLVRYIFSGSLSRPTVFSESVS